MFTCFQDPGAHFQLFSSLRRSISVIFEPPESIFSYFRASGVHFQLFSNLRSSFLANIINLHGFYVVSGAPEIWESGSGTVT